MEIERLYSEIEEMKEKVLRAEHERDNVQSKLHRSEREIVHLKAHHDDITADMKSKIKRLNRRVKLVNTIENALLELYFEIRDRSMDDFQQDSGGRAIRTQDVERKRPNCLQSATMTSSWSSTTCAPTYGYSLLSRRTTKES